MNFDSEALIRNRNTKRDSAVFRKAISRFRINGICIKEGGTTNAPSMRYRFLPLSFNAMLAVCVGLCGCPFRFLLFYFLWEGKSFNHSLLITFLK
jgi:hypothetical protein